MNIYIFYCVYIFSKAVTFQNENGKHTKESKININKKLIKSP